MCAGRYRLKSILKYTIMCRQRGRRGKRGYIRADRTFTRQNWRFARKAQYHSSRHARRESCNCNLLSFRKRHSSIYARNFAVVSGVCRSHRRNCTTRNIVLLKNLVVKFTTSDLIYHVTLYTSTRLRQNRAIFKALVTSHFRVVR